MKARVIILLALIAFGVTLAIVVGQRLSSEAMAVLLGVIAGVAASIPTSLIVVWLATRAYAPPARTVEVHRADPPPAERVVVVQQPPASPAGPGNWQPAHGHPPYPAPLPSPRRFTIIGGADESEWEM